VLIHIIKMDKEIFAPEVGRSVFVVKDPDSTSSECVSNLPYVRPIFASE
jgi:hypothetical protein